MPTLDVINQEKKKVGSIQLSDEVFSSKVNTALVHQVLKAQLASRRQGTVRTKTRAEVRGGGKKPFRQKGTGYARQGSTRSAIQVGGGRAFGPKPRDYTQKVPKKMVQGALRSALSDRAQSDRLLVIDEFKLKEAKTKILNEVLQKKLQLKNALLVDETNESLSRAGRNLKGIKVLPVSAVNLYDLIRHEWIVLTQKAAAEVDQKLKPSRDS